MSVELNNEFGHIDISNDVIAQIAGGAAIECYGIVKTHVYIMLCDLCPFFGVVHFTASRYADYSTSEGKIQ